MGMDNGLRLLVLRGQFRAAIHDMLASKALGFGQKEGRETYYRLFKKEKRPIT